MVIIRMNIIEFNELTMTSQQIAELVESRHDPVARTIERLAKSGAIELPPMVEIKTATKPMKAYSIGKRDSYVIVAQLSPLFTAKLVDRWQELEQKEQFKIPQTLPEALQLAADLALKIEQDKPKIEVYERLAEITLYSRDGLHKMYNRDPSTIDELLERYNEQLKEFKR